MDKHAQAKIADVLEESARALRETAAERDALQEKVAAYETRDRVTKVAAEMHRKGIETDTPLAELHEKLAELARTGKLAAREEAVALVAPNMKLASLSTLPSRAGDSNPLVTFLVTGDT